MSQKRFGNKICRRHGQSMSKSVADRYAKSWRKNAGKSVHVVKEGKYYSLYIRNKER